MDGNGPLTAEPTEAFTHIREPGAMKTLIERLGAAKRVAVDTEADSLHSYFEKCCLVQLTFSGENYIVDPLSELDLADFLEALAERPLIFHGGDYDLRMMRASMDFEPRGEVFDTMLAAQLLGIEQFGLAALLEQFLEVTIGKEGQKSDWSRRPLSDKQLRYAVNDTRYLERLADLLQKQLIDRARTGWHEETCGAMVEATRRDNRRDPDEAWRIKGAGKLTRRQLAYLRELWHWRDKHARRSDLPPFKVLGNLKILELIEWAESNPGASLRQGPKLPRNIGGTRFRTLAEALTRVDKAAETSWPPFRKPSRREKPRLDCKEEIKALRAECARQAEALEIAPSTLAPRAALEAIARERPRSIEGIMEDGGLLRWQAEIIQDAVEKVLHSGDSEQSN